MKILHYGIIMLHIHDDEVKRFFRTGD